MLSDLTQAVQKLEKHVKHALPHDHAQENQELPNHDMCGPKNEA